MWRQEPARVVGRLRKIDEINEKTKIQEYCRPRRSVSACNEEELLHAVRRETGLTAELEILLKSKHIKL